MLYTATATWRNAVGGTVDAVFVFALLADAVAARADRREAAHVEIVAVAGRAGKVEARAALDVLERLDDGELDRQLVAVAVDRIDGSVDALAALRRRFAERRFVRKHLDVLADDAHDHAEPEVRRHRRRRRRREHDVRCARPLEDADRRRHAVARAAPARHVVAAAQRVAALSHDDANHLRLLGDKHVELGAVQSSNKELPRSCVVIQSRVKNCLRFRCLRWQ